MAHLLFCSRLWCPIEEDDKFQMVKVNSEIIVGEGM